MERSLSELERQRYARQIGPGVLSEQQQLRLKQATVLVTRVGGMGGPAAQMLAMAGVGRLIIAHGGPLIEPDLNRQVLGEESGLGRPRAPAFAAYLRSLNRWLEVEPLDYEPDDDQALQLARRCDAIVSCPPTFAERLRLNRAAVAAGKPLIDAAQWGMTGTLGVFQTPATPCLACVYPHEPPFEELFPVVGAISAATGSLAALETIKILSGAGRPRWGRLLTYDGHQGVVTDLQLKPPPTACAVCGQSAASTPTSPP